MRWIWDGFWEGLGSHVGNFFEFFLFFFGFVTISRKKLIFDALGPSNARPDPSKILEKSLLEGSWNHVVAKVAHITLQEWPQASFFIHFSLKFEACSMSRGRILEFLESKNHGESEIILDQIYCTENSIINRF